MGKIAFSGAQHYHKKKYMTKRETPTRFGFEDQTELSRSTLLEAGLNQAPARLDAE